MVSLVKVTDNQVFNLKLIIISIIYIELREYVFLFKCFIFLIIEKSALKSVVDVGILVELKTSSKISFKILEVPTFYLQIDRLKLTEYIWP